MSTTTTTSTEPVPPPPAPELPADLAAGLRRLKLAAIRRAAPDVLQVSFPAQPADQYCQAFSAGENVDAAEALYRFSNACGINPQVMLVTLQKESGLLIRTDPTATTYDAAWGWHCPDTGPDGSPNCDPAYAGFFNQGYGMAKQWARYKVDPDKYNFHPGQTTTILWNVVESGCGGSQVIIANQATASLYDYTPYQPNPASLVAYPGTGAACSSYGNRNFFRLFQKYFGFCREFRDAHFVELTCR